MTVLRLRKLRLRRLYRFTRRNRRLIQLAVMSRENGLKLIKVTVQRVVTPFTLRFFYIFTFLFLYFVEFTELIGAHAKIAHSTRAYSVPSVLIWCVISHEVRYFRVLNSIWVQIVISILVLTVVQILRLWDCKLKLVGNIFLILN